jgi:hypothetical protein
MKLKRSETHLNTGKIMTELEAYEKSPARGGLRIDLPVEQAVKALAKAKREQRIKSETPS